MAGEPESCAPQRVAVVREDRRPGQPGRVLGVVHPEFQLLQNHDGVKLFDELLGGGRYETGGYLKHGEVVWLQAPLAKPIQIAGNNVRGDTAAFAQFLAKLLPEPKEPASAKMNTAVALGYETRREKVMAARAEIQKIRVDGCRQRLGGAQVPAEEETWWGALNTITAWVDHVQVVQGDHYAHQMFGAGDALKSNAFARIQDLVKAA